MRKWSQSSISNVHGAVLLEYHLVPLALLAVLVRNETRSSHRSGNRLVPVGVSIRSIRCSRNGKCLFDGNAHMTTVAALATVALILTDAAFDSNAGVAATTAWPLAITAFLALTAALTAWLRRKVFLVRPELCVVYVERAT